MASALELGPTVIQYKSWGEEVAYIYRYLITEIYK